MDGEMWDGGRVTVDNWARSQSAIDTDPLPFVAKLRKVSLMKDLEEPEMTQNDRDVFKSETARRTKLVFSKEPW